MMRIFRQPFRWLPEWDGGPDWSYVWWLWWSVEWTPR